MIFIYGYFESLWGPLSPWVGLLLWTGLFILIYSGTLWKVIIIHSDSSNETIIWNDNKSFKKGLNHPDPRSVTLWILIGLISRAKIFNISSILHPINCNFPPQFFFSLHHFKDSLFDFWKYWITTGCLDLKCIYHCFRDRICCLNLLWRLPWKTEMLKFMKM